MNLLTFSHFNFSSLFIIFLIIGCCFAHDWKKIAKTPQDRQIHLKFGIVQPNINGLANVLEQVSNPKSAQYQAYLSRDEIRQYTASSQCIKKVLGFINNVFSDSLFVAPKVNYYGDWIDVITNAAAAENVLSTSFHDFVHTITGHKHTTSIVDPIYPQEIVNCVDYIAGAHPRLPPYSALITPSRRPVSPRSGFDQNLVVSAQEGDQRLVALVQLWCAGPAPVHNLDCPCCDNPHEPGLLSKVTVTFEQNGNTLTRNVPISQENCVFDSQVSTYVCRSGVAYPLENDVPVQITSSEYFPSSNGYLIWNAPNPYFPGKMSSTAMLRSFYNVRGQGGLASNNTQSVVEFLDQYYNEQDLDQYIRLNVLPTDLQATPIIVKGPNNSSQPGGEASLDIQAILGIAPKVQTFFWSTGGLNQYNNQEKFLEWATAVAESNNPPLVNSVSYGDDEITLPKSYTDRVDAELIKFGTRGLSALFASMDDGVCGVSCRGNEAMCNSPFRPQYPASSRYATAVGGTQFSKFATPICSATFSGIPVVCPNEGEVVCSSDIGGVITSGGGFSNYYSRPSWQSKAVDQYLNKYKSSLPPAQFFNASSRAYPDISGSSRSYPIIIGGELTVLFGTSASTPLVAGFLSLINDQLLSQGLKPIGFINPMLYQAAEEQPDIILNDVVVGDNRCAAYTPDLVCCEHGFKATPGWDASSGLGTLNFEKFQNYAMNAATKQQL